MSLPSKLPPASLTASVSKEQIDVRPGDTTPSNISPPRLFNKEAPAVADQNVIASTDVLIPATSHTAPERRNQDINTNSSSAPIQTEHSFTTLKKAALSGDVSAQYELGKRYFEGKDIKKNDAKARIWFRKAAKQGHSKAQCHLGELYRYGHGIKRDFTIAVRWFKKSAKQGDADGQNNLGDMYQYGNGVQESINKAINWYNKSAEQKHATAQLNLGRMYAEGLGVKRDETEALKWYHLSAEQGNANAQYILGNRYAFGEGIEKNDALATYWYQKAADQDNQKAQSSLGYRYREGLGVEKNLKLATYWLFKSELNTENNSVSLPDYPDVIEYIPEVLNDHPEFSKIKKWEFTCERYFNENSVTAIGKLISSGLTIQSLKLWGSDTVGIEGIKILIKSLKLSTTVSTLSFSSRSLNAKKQSEINSLLAQNLTIAELCKYVEDHPLIRSEEIPIDVIPLIVQPMVVFNIKNGLQKEFTLKAIDELLLSFRKTS